MLLKQKLTSEIKSTFDNELKSVKEALEAKFTLI